MKTIDTCSWIFWNQYEKKIPQKGNEGSLRGTLVHLIFELLLSPRHKKHYKAIIDAQDIKGSPAIRRLVLKLLVKSKILNTVNYDMCNEMILVGLKTDFFGDGGSLGEPEFRFELQNENPKYKVRGYIDKLVFYNDGKIKIVDYKSSKQKFKGDDIAANIQAMVYSLVGYKIFGADDVSAEFIFLRFPRQPLQQVHPSGDQLKGFEYYLSHIYHLINNFSEKDAVSNMAADSSKNRWLCKAGKWECPYMRPFKYYALVDGDGKTVKTALAKTDLKAEEGQSLIIKYYEGCPSYKNVSAKGAL